MYQKLKQKLSRGSILAVSLIILGLMLVSALSFSLVTVQERKASIGENTSNQALQTASTGVELVSQDIIKGGHDNTSQLDGCDAVTGLIIGSNYKVELRDNSGNKIACNNGASISMVRNIKSVGTAGQNQRAVEVAVAADPTCAWYQIDSDCGGRPCYGQTSLGYDLYDNILNRATNNELCRVKHNGGWAVTATYDIAMAPSVPPFWQRPVKYFDGASWVEVTNDGGYAIKSVYCCTVSCN